MSAAETGGMVGGEREFAVHPSSIYLNSYWWKILNRCQVKLDLAVKSNQERERESIFHLLEYKNCDFNHNCQQCSGQSSCCFEVTSGRSYTRHSLLRHYHILSFFEQDAACTKDSPLIVLVGYSAVIYAHYMRFDFFGHQKCQLHRSGC